MADPAEVADPFVQLSLDTWRGLNDAVRELDWIADGGDSSATFDDRDEAALARIKYERESVRVMQRLTAFLAKQLTVKTPTSADLVKAKEIATELGKFIDRNVQAKTVIKAATNLLKIYGNTKSP